ncbi:MAG: deoxynucleoside kinase [Aggregatilineales bacterium]
MTQHRFIAVAGNIGAGKSTLTAMLADHFGWQPFYEANADNPYLADFYQDMSRWSFHSQVFFLGRRLEHHRTLIDHPGAAIQDRTVYEDAEIFACNLYRQGILSERDYDAYRHLYEAIASFLPPPDFLIYLQSDVDTLLKRIAGRGRDFEQNIDPAYLQQLNVLYDDWISDWTRCPVLTLDMDTMDFQHNHADFMQIVQQIEGMPV